MPLLVADTGPVNYLILIRHVDVLPRMFERTVIPVPVQIELSSPEAPRPVRMWIASPPSWLEVVETREVETAASLHKGEAAAISLAASLPGDLLLMDERRGVKAARSRGLRVTGTLGLLEAAAGRGLVDFAEAVEHLRQTTFRNPEALLDQMLKRNSQKIER